jgi:hypothetical protein
MLNLSSSGSRGRAGRRRARGAWLGAVAVAVALALGVPTASAAARAGGSQATAARATAAQATAAQTARQYVIRFWPRYISFVTQNTVVRVHGYNSLLGPVKITPQFHAVVAINDDTRYAFGMVNLTNGPVVLTIPPTKVVYSLLVIDLFGNVLPVSVPAQTPGTYALVPRGFTGKLPAGLTKVTVPYPVTVWNLRADRYSSTGVNTTAQADAFRRALHMTTLAQYEANAAAGPAKILPVVPTFFPSIKLGMDTAVTATPTAFLRVMQRAVANPLTQPLSASDIQLSQAFNADFAAALQARRRGNPVPLARIDAGARAAYAAIVAAWLTDTGPTGWIHQDNFGEWGTDYLARAAGNEYIYGGNNNPAAGYWDAFTDRNGRPLNGALRRYTLTFSASQLPDAKRFWSVTAYNPVLIEPIPNRLNKYLVARYTPGLVYNKDGGVTIYMAAVKPAGVPTANWLPVRRGLFNVLLRVYGPTGNTAPDASPPYIPPAIMPMR